MKQTVLQKSIVQIIFLFTTTLYFAQSNNDIVKQAQDLLEKKYIFLDKAKETNIHLSELIKKGVFNNKSSKGFAKLMAKELQEITKDKHFYFTPPNFKQLPSEKTRSTPLKRSVTSYNPMLRSFQLWESNIGYIDFAFFGGSTQYRDRIDTVLLTLLNKAVLFSNSLEYLYNTTCQEDIDLFIDHTMPSKYKYDISQTQNLNKEGLIAINVLMKDRKINVINALVSKTNIRDKSFVGEVLNILTALLIDVIRSEVKLRNIRSKYQLALLVRNMNSKYFEAKNTEISFLESILDADDDGSVIDDVAGMVLGGNKKKGGIGGLLGGIFGNNN